MHKQILYIEVFAQTAQSDSNLEPNLLTPEFPIAWTFANNLGSLISPDLENPLQQYKFPLYSMFLDP